jgi:hypothetical protein
MTFFEAADPLAGAWALLRQAPAAATAWLGHALAAVQAAWSAACAS